MSTSSSTSSSQQTAKSSTAVSKVPNAEIVNKKTANKGPRSMEKTMRTENLKRNNEVTTSEQPADSTESNLTNRQKKDSGPEIKS
uniref:Uncharacterized protein n=1 Tax=Strongyloides papillosus TaxID=174720 RepID=A0A0N5B9P0_STREA